ncbi:MAG: hypothetical protein H6719_30825 [Sandaracinaceae bacterium]|nr:hypothetical protein [Sandaracinaceae bacterium]
MRAHLASVGTPMALLLASALAVGVVSGSVGATARGTDAAAIEATDDAPDAPRSSAVVELAAEETEDDSDSGDDPFSLGDALHVALATQRHHGGVLGSDRARLHGAAARAARAPPA